MPQDARITYRPQPTLPMGGNRTIVQLSFHETFAGIDLSEFLLCMDMVLMRSKDHPAYLTGDADDEINRRASSLQRYGLQRLTSLDAYATTPPELRSQEMKDCLSTFTTLMQSLRNRMPSAWIAGSVADSLNERLTACTP